MLITLYTLRILFRHADNEAVRSSLESSSSSLPPIWRQLKQRPHPPQYDLTRPSVVHVSR